jgi:hypothetical protein
MYTDSGLAPFSLRAGSVTGSKHITKQKDVLIPTRWIGDNYGKIIRLYFWRQYSAEVFSPFEQK